jgi:leader peptidase (prepilin peptidase)/N-methyltransferase
MDFIAYSLLASLLIAIAGIDFDHQIIPDEMVVCGFILGGIYLLYGYYIGASSITLFSRAGGFLIGGGLFLLIAILSNGGMGGGDIKLMAMLGFWLGIQSILLIILLSFVIGAVISVFLLAAKIKGRKEAIPFGPFIAMAAFITICFQNEMISWYLQRFM